jgi:hypothetical protein
MNKALYNQLNPFLVLSLLSKSLFSAALSVSGWRSCQAPSLFRSIINARAVLSPH